MKPLEQSKEIIRKHCEKQTKPCYLMRDLEDPFSEIETELKDAEKNNKILDLLFRKGVNIILLDYLHHINPDNAFETYNKEMNKAWCDLYELNRDQFNMVIDYIEERRKKWARDVSLNQKEKPL